MSSFASPIPPPVFDSDESDVASQQSTDSSYLASQFTRQQCSSQVLPPSSSQFFDESTCGSSSQPCQDDSLLNDSMNIESALSRLTTLSQTPSEISYHSSPQPSLLAKPKTTYTVKYATTNKRKRSSTRNRQDAATGGGVALKTPDQSPLTRRKNLDYVQESTFRSPKVQRRSRHHDESISLTCSTTSEADLVNTNPFTPQLHPSQKKRFKCESPAISKTTPRYRTRLAVKRDQQAAAAAAAHVPSERRQSFGKVPAGASPSLRELTIRRFDEEFHQESLLGHGEFSHVYLCKNRLDGITYAVKASKQAVLGTSYERMAWRETCAHAVLISHENLVRYHSAWIEPDGRFFVQLEFCNAGSLEDLIEKNRRQSNVIAEGQLKQILHQMSDALSYMHAQDLAHLDVKPANIMLCHRSIEMQSTRDEHDYFFDTDDERTDIIYKLTDLGHVSQISLAAVEEDGDSRYLALEALQRAQSKQLNLAKCDIFSLGLTLYVAATNDELPRQGNEWQQLRLNIGESLRSIPHCTSQLNQLLLAQMCHLDPNQRPSAYEVSRSRRFSLHRRFDSFSFSFCSIRTRVQRCPPVANRFGTV